MNLTPHQLAAMYDCLCAFPPFSKWKLPPSDEVEFHASRHGDRFGHFQAPVKGNAPKIGVSTRYVGYFNTLAFYMAHEMIHLKQWRAGTETRNTVHNAEFKRLATLVCSQFGWDVKQFIL